MNIAEVKLEALELIARFSHAIDGRDPDVFIRLFTEEGVLEHRRKQGDRAQFQGRKELSGYFSNLLTQRGDDQPRHHVRNTVFSVVTDQKVSASTYFLLTRVSGKGGFAEVIETGLFHDDIVLTPEGWKIHKRIVIHD
jgi:hypothetical protein